MVDAFILVVAAAGSIGIGLRLANPTLTWLRDQGVTVSLSRAGPLIASVYAVGLFAIFTWSYFTAVPARHPGADQPAAQLPSPERFSVRP